MSADEEKTRVLPRVPAAVPRGRLPAAAATGEKIVFHCPNGHRIVASAAFAGKQGKCSKCQVDVTIPGPGDRPSAAAVADEEAAAPAGSGVADEMPETQPPAEDQAAGIPGPEPAEAAVAADQGEASAAGEDPAGAEEKENWSFMGGQPDQQPSGYESAWAPPDAAGHGGEAGNATAILVARLWAERDHGGVIELHLDGGSVILPEWYDANWSRGTHGLFASQAADGTVTLTAVAWETVRKVVVRQLTEVPNDMFT